MSNDHTMTGLKLRAFDFDDLAVRTVLRRGEPWFVAADICRVLEIANPRDAVSGLDDDEKTTVANTDGHSGKRGGAQSFNLISESGLYALVFKSRKPEARRFRKWVTAEVLPAIRAEGRYEIVPPQAQVMNDVRELLLTSARAVRDKTLDVGRAQQIANLSARYLEAIRIEGDAIGYETLLGVRCTEASGRLLPESDASAQLLQGLPQQQVCGAEGERFDLSVPSVPGKEKMGGGESGTGSQAPGEADLP